VRAYHDDILQFSEYFAGKPGPEGDLTDATKKDIRQFMVYLLDNRISPRSLRRKIASLNAFYKYCLKSGIINDNPVSGLILPKVSKRLPDFIKEPDIKTLFSEDIFPKGFSGIRDQFILELFYATGMRLSELVGLKDSNYDKLRGEIKILGKRNKERIVPLTLNIIRLAEKYIDARNAEFGQTDHDRLIISDNGKPVYPRMVQRIVRKYLMTATTLENKGPHLLRHTFATHMLNNGADLNAVKELLGHSNLAATEIYTHNTYEKLKSIYKQAHPRA